MVMWGSRDRIIPVAHAQVAHQGMPGSRLEIFDNAGHFPQLDDPYRFDVTRKPNDHVTFGPGGPHFCLGAHLARLETKILFQELLPLLDTIELAGPVERIRSNFVNGIKRMPVRVSLI